MPVRPTFHYVPLLRLETFAVRHVSDVGPHKKTEHIIRIMWRAT